MEVREFLEVLRRRWLSASIVALLVLAGAAAATLATTPTYTSTTRLFFAVQGTESVTDLAQGSTFAEKQMTSYAQVATSPLVLDPVMRQLNLPGSVSDLARSVTAVVPADTVILQVTVTRTDAGQATLIADAIGRQLAEVAGDLSPGQGSGAQAVKATILAPASVPTAPSAPNVLRNLVLGLALGLVLGVAVALLRQVLDNGVRDEADVRAVTDRPLLGSIAFNDTIAQHPVMMADDPSSQSAEGIRRLRTNLQFVGAGADSKALVVTSSVPGEGKSMTSLNLAVALADAGLRVLLIDADLRRPSLAGYLGLEGSAGLTTVLIGRAEAADVIQVWRDSDLHILTSGQVPPNPSELLGSRAMVELLHEVSHSYDVILLDTPPLMPVTDASILTKITAGALVVVGADRIHRGQLTESLSALTAAGGLVHGLVLNKIARRDAKGYGGYYGPREGDLVADPAGWARPVVAAQVERPEVAGVSS